MPWRFGAFRFPRSVPTHPGDPVRDRMGHRCAPRRGRPGWRSTLPVPMLIALLSLFASAAAQVVYDVAVARQAGATATPVTAATMFGAGDRLRLEITVEVGPEFDVAANDLIILLPVPAATAPSGGVTPGFATNWLDADFRVVQADRARFVNWSNLAPIPAGESVSLVVFFDVESASGELALELLELPGRVSVGSASNAFPNASLEVPAPVEAPVAETPGRDEVTAMQLFRVCSQIGFEEARLRCFDAAAEALGFEIMVEEGQ